MLHTINTEKKSYTVIRSQTRIRIKEDNKDYKIIA